MDLSCVISRQAWGKLCMCMFFVEKKLCLFFSQAIIALAWRSSGLKNLTCKIVTPELAFKAGLHYHHI